MSEGITTFLVDLHTTPQDAEEVHLRGNFVRKQYFTGPLPSGWKPPANMKIVGSNRILSLTSKPFDVTIKAANGHFPAPIVSHDVPFKIIDAKWIVDYGRNNFILQARRLDGNPWNMTSLVVYDLQIRDENGRLLHIDDGGVGEYNQSLFSSRRTQADLFFPFIMPDDAHDQASEIKARGPLRLRAKVSDGNCWPLSINRRVSRVEMPLSDFGSAPNTR